MKKIVFFAFILTLLGCVSGSREVQWKEISNEELKVEVEQKSKPNSSWYYSGSDQQFHYVYRMVLDYIHVGKRRFFFKVKKMDCEWLQSEDEQIFTGKPRGYEKLFSKLDETVDGYSHTHLLSRGIVRNPEFDKAFEESLQRGAEGGGGSGESND